MALYRDTVARCSLAQIRMAYPPRFYRALNRVRLEHEGVVSDVAIEQQDTPGCIASQRRWLVCPRCGRRAGVLGCVEGIGWACRICAGWRSRNRPAGGDDRLNLIGTSP